MQWHERGRTMALLNVAARVASGGGVLMFNLLVALTTGPAGKGVLAVLGVLLNTLYAVANLSLTRGVLAELGAAPAGIRGGTVRTLVRLQGAASWLTVLIAVLLLGFYPGLREGIPLLALAVFLFCLPFKMPFESYLFLLPPLGRAGSANALHAARGLLPLVLWAGVWLAWGKLTVTGIALLYGVSFVLLWLAAAWRLPRGVDDGEPGVPAGTLLRGGLQLHTGYLAAYLLLFVDQLLVKHWWGVEEVGFYSLAVNVFTGLMIFGEGIQFVLLSRSAALAQDPARLRRATGKAMALAAAGSALLALATWAVAPALLARFLPAFVPSLPSLCWLLPGLVAVVIPLQSETFLLLTRRAAVVSLAPLAALGVNLGLNFMLTPERGAVGAAMASTAAYVVWAMIVLTVFWRAWGRRVRSA